jgi:hypothetical protein
MPRARNIKPGFFVNDDLAELPPLARLLFIGLWTLADCEGRLKGKPKQIKAQILPYDECCIEALLFDLDKSGFIQSYSVQGQPVIQVVNFVKHQNPHKNEKSKGTEFCSYDERDIKEEAIQGHAGESSKIAINPDKNHTDRADSLLLKEERGKRKEESAKEPSKKNTQVSPEDLAAATSMYNCILQINPGHKEPNFDSWANTIRLMRERDGRTYEEIGALFSFANQDEFWRSNILSPEKLRKQWDKLVIQSNRGKAQKQSFKTMDYGEAGSL